MVHLYPSAGMVYPDVLATVADEGFVTTPVQFPVPSSLYTGPYNTYTKGQETGYEGKSL